MKLSVKLVAFVYLLVLVLFVMASAVTKDFEINTTSANPVSFAERISLFGGDLSFIPPAGFKSLKKERLKRKLPDNDKSLLIFANADQTGSITVGIDDGMAFQPKQLVEVKKFIEGIHRNYSGWVTSEIVEMNGRQWFHFEFVTPEMDDLAKLTAPPKKGEKPQKAIDDTPYHYVTYSTVFRGKLVNFEFVSHVKNYSQLKDDYLKSIKSIRTKDTPF